MSWLAEHAFSERSLGMAWKKVQKRESDDGNLARSILKFQEEAEEKNTALIRSASRWKLQAIPVHRS